MVQVTETHLIARNIPVALHHLKDRLVQTNAWDDTQPLMMSDLILLLKQKIHETNFENAKQDVLPFLKDKQSVEVWSTEFFLEVIQQLKNE